MSKYTDSILAAASRAKQTEPYGGLKAFADAHRLSYTELSRKVRAWERTQEANR